MSKGYFGIGIENGKTYQNIGTLWRSAHAMGAAFIFTIGERYKKESTDTARAWHSVPLYHYPAFTDFYKNLPFNCQLVGIELEDAPVPLSQFSHPARAIYLLGAEDNGLTLEARAKCHQLVQIELPSLNVAVAGSLVLYDRLIKK